LEEGEIFDSNLLKDYVSEEISKGNRNIVLDCVSLEYIYSDTINVLMALNRRILDVSGRLSLMGPGPEAMQTLRKTGIHNILKIYETEIELQKSSEDIILQTSSYKLTDIMQAAKAGAAQTAPSSDFDSFRSAIGDSIAAATQTGAIQIPPNVYMNTSPAQPPTQSTGNGYTTPSAPQPAAGYGSQNPPESGFYQQTAPQTPSGGYGQPQQAAQPPLSNTNRFDDDNDDEFIEKRHKSPAVGIVVTAVVIVVVAGGAFFALRNVQPKDAKPQKTASAPVQVPQSSSAQPEAGQPGDAAPVAQPSSGRSTPAAKQPNKERSEASAQTRTTPAQRAAAQQAAAAEKPSAPSSTKNILTITSSPSGATVRVDGKVMGTTPFSWNNPFFGGMRISVSKDGFEEAERSTEYVGGSRTEPFSLEPKIVQSRAAATQQPSAAATPAQQQSARTTEPAPTAQPVATTPATAPAATAAAAASEPESEPATIFLSSLPPVAEIYLDGRMIGKTNVAELKVRAGTHTLKFVKAGKEVTKEMTFKPGKNPSQLIRFQ
jgi:anti-anti-sigma factor